jgi:hypothetical protein
VSANTQDDAAACEIAPKPPLGDVRLPTPDERHVRRRVRVGHVHAGPRFPRRKQARLARVRGRAEPEPDAVAVGDPLLDAVALRVSVGHAKQQVHPNVGVRLPSKFFAPSSEQTGGEWEKNKTERGVGARPDQGGESRFAATRHAVGDGTLEILDRLARPPENREAYGALHHVLGDKHGPRRQPVHVFDPSRTRVEPRRHVTQ